MVVSTDVVQNPNGLHPLSELTPDTVNQPYFQSFSGAVDTLNSIFAQNKKLAPVQKYLFNKIQSVPDIAYFATVDPDVSSLYMRAINSAALFLLRLNTWIQGNHADSVKNDALAAYGMFAKALTDLGNPADKYVSKTNSPTYFVTVYKPASDSLRPVTDKIEAKVLSRFLSLQTAGTIDLSEFQTALDAYNKFILDLSVWKTHPNDVSKARALKIGTVFLKTYAK